FGTAGQVGKLVLAAHSGGGKVMLALARSKGSDDYAAKLAECWGFDCLYGQPPGHPLSNATPAPSLSAGQQDWTAWETKNKAHREMVWAEWLGSKNGVPFYLYCATGAEGGGTGTRSTNLDKLATRRSIGKAHVIFDGTASHDGILRPRFGER